MSVAVYPTGLPKFSESILREYEESLPDNLIRTPTDVGPPLTRPRTRSPRRPYRIGFILTEAQRDTLDNFFNEDLTFGSLEFRTSLPTDVNQDGVFKFTSPPNYRAVSASRWAVSLNVELLRLVS